MRLYVAGPMTGLPDSNYPAFDAAAARLRALGFDVVNPARPGDESWDWTDWMRRGISDVCTVNGIALLPGWERSRGAFLEVTVAKGLDLPVRPEPEWTAADLRWSR